MRLLMFLSCCRPGAVVRVNSRMRVLFGYQQTELFFCGPSSSCVVGSSGCRQRAGPSSRRLFDPASCCRVSFGDGVTRSIPEDRGCTRDIELVQFYQQRKGLLPTVVVCSRAVGLSGRIFQSHPTTHTRKQSCLQTDVDS